MKRLHRAGPGAPQMASPLPAAGSARSVCFQERNPRPREVSNRSKVSGWEIGKRSLELPLIPDPGDTRVTDGGHTFLTGMCPSETHFLTSGRPGRASYGRCGQKDGSRL